MCSSYTVSQITEKSETSVTEKEKTSFVYSNFRIRDATTEAIATWKKSKKMIRGKQKLKKQLHEAVEKKDLIEKLKEQGRVDKAVTLKMRSKWKAAFDKSEGRKVRDDVTLIKKSLKKEAKAKAKSKKEWKERKEQLEAKMAKKQLKRVRNVQHKKYKKKEKKINALKKKGRIF